MEIYSPSWANIIFSQPLKGQWEKITGTSSLAWYIYIILQILVVEIAFFASIFSFSLGKSLQKIAYTTNCSTYIVNSAAYIHITESKTGFEPER